MRRLAPWYYDFDLDGVKTASLGQVDMHGHRRVDVASVSRHIWQGKSVLDAGCNEGGWTFSAVSQGAGHVEAFDCRPINVEKAELVAAIKGVRNVEFSVHSCDSWLDAHPERSFDYVFLCGLLYHLTEPWKTIEQYSALAKEGVLVSTVLYGGEDGYSPFPEIETVAASADPSEVSMMPNSTRTVIEEFGRHGLYPRYYWESRYGEYWGGCTIMFFRWRWPGMYWSISTERPRSVSVHFFVESVSAETDSTVISLELSFYNETFEELGISGSIRAFTVDGTELLSAGPQRSVLAARPSKGSESNTPSHVVPLRLEVPAPLPLLIEAEVATPGGVQLHRRSIRLEASESSPM